MASSAHFVGVVGALLAVRAGLERLRAGFEALVRAAQDRGEPAAAVDPKHLSRLSISLLQGLLIQIAVYGDHIDIDGYARAAAEMLDGAPAG